MNKKKDWQAGLGIKSHKPFCKRPSGGLSCPSSGHSVNKRRASTEQATGIDWTSDGHQLNKRRASTEQASGINWTSVGHQLNKRRASTKQASGINWTSVGHQLNKRRASTEQASGINWTSVGHQLNKRRAFIAHAVCTECPKVRRFLGTPCRSAALLLCIMPHDDFVILKWLFYDTSIRLMILPWYFL